MANPGTFGFVCFLGIACLAGPITAQRPDPESPFIHAVEALIRILEQPETDASGSIAKLTSDKNRDAVSKEIAMIQESIRGFDSAEIAIGSSTSGQFIYEVGERTVTVDFEMTASDPVLIESISIVPETGSDTDSQVPLAWDSLEQQLDAAAEQMDLDGAVFMVRDGKVVLHKAWGQANREKQIPNRTDTIFAIGSAPIDFTHAGILLLLDREKLSLDDPITKFFDDVPDDKQAMTIRHLMTGASGLPDFHELPTDENPDHGWIDRDEAVRRIFAQQLLFAPGTGNEHSHSAWGLLAAIIEIASGQTYQEFSKQHLYEPAGLTDTGYFGDPLPENRVAVGYGEQKSSDPNSPPHWGKTSWLVMGSGGQVSTLIDMHRWAVALRSGKILSPESTKLYVGDGNQVSADGDMFGFEFMHSHDPESIFLIISNSIDSRDKRRGFSRLARRILKLVREKPDRYSLGIALRIVEGEPISIDRLFEGGAAERDGLRAGDVLVSANEIVMVDTESVARLAELIGKGQPIEFRIRRGSEESTVTVRPNRKK